MPSIDERLKKLEADAATKRAELENLRAAKSTVQEQIDEVKAVRDTLVPHRPRKVAP
jgi:chromosome segregation ATPase